MPEKWRSLFGRRLPAARRDRHEGPIQKQEGEAGVGRVDPLPSVELVRENGNGHHVDEPVIPRHGHARHWGENAETGKRKNKIPRKMPTPKEELLFFAKYGSYSFHY